MSFINSSVTREGGRTKSTVERSITRSRRARYMCTVALTVRNISPVQRLGYVINRLNVEVGSANVHRANLPTVFSIEDETTCGRVTMRLQVLLFGLAAVSILGATASQAKRVYYAYARWTKGGRKVVFTDANVVLSFAVACRCCCCWLLFLMSIHAETSRLPPLLLLDGFIRIPIHKRVR